MIDSTYVGGPARYANHSYNGNAQFEIKSFESGGQVALMCATEDIKEGDEIKPDYKYKDMDWYKRCLCGEVYCRKWDVVVLTS